MAGKDAISNDEVVIEEEERDEKPVAGMSERMKTKTKKKGVFAGGREISVNRLFFDNKQKAADFYNEVNIVSNVEH